MASTRQPLLDLHYNDETGRYIGMLERKITKYQIDDIRFRALLELLTDQDWDDYKFSEEDGEIKNLAVDALKRRLGLSDEDARKLVQERWDRHNPEPSEGFDARTYMVGQTPTPHVTTMARPISDDGKPTSPGYDVNKHLAGIAQAKRHMSEGSNRQEIR